MRDFRPSGGLGLSDFLSCNNVSAGVIGCVGEGCIYTSRSFVQRVEDLFREGQGGMMQSYSLRGFFFSFFFFSFEQTGPVHATCCTP